MTATTKTDRDAEVRPGRRPERRMEIAERAARAVSRFTGSTAAFMLALFAVVAWGVSGPLFGYSENWQLVINTSTTIITFLMVFLIQRSQNKDSTAVHLKLNEIVAALGGASNRLVTAEDLPEHELEVLHRHYSALAAAVVKQDLRGAHSVDEHARPRSARRSRALSPAHAQRTTPRRRTKTR